MIEKLWRRGRQTGRGGALPRGGGRPRVLRDQGARSRAEGAQQPAAPLREGCERVAKAGGASARPRLRGRELPRVPFPRKQKRSLRASAPRHG